MKKKMNYLILLLTTFFIMVACTNVEDTSITDIETEPQEETITSVVDEPVLEETPTQSNNELFSGYKLIEVDGGDLSGHREPNVVVDIGFGDREYWAFTLVIFRLVK